MRARALVAGITTAGCTAFTLTSPALLAQRADAAGWPGHPDRNVISYTVRSGDTLTGLATRYHAWTSELAAINHLSTSSYLRIGQHLKIPVVVSAQKKADNKAKARQAAAHKKAAQAKAQRIARAVAAVKARYQHKNAKKWPGHPDRILVPYTAKVGDTPYSISAHYHAWTRELTDLNHLGVLRAGQHIQVPIVVSAMKRARAADIRKATKKASKAPTAQKPATPSQDQKMFAAGWRNWTMSRAQIRDIVTTKAKRRGVDPTLALAIAWQESGWQQPLISSAGALGVMQLLPSTSTWMNLYAGRTLNPRGTHDNILGGVLFLKYLTNLAGPTHRKQIIAAYYQGMTAIGKKHHWYDDTKRYVASVSAIYKNLKAGRL